MSYPTITLHVEKDGRKSGPFCVQRLHSLSDDTSYSI